MITTQVTARGNAVGLSNHLARYSDEDVARIRRLRSEGWKRREVAEEIGCSLSYIDIICAGTCRAKASTRTIQRLELSDAGKVADLRAEGHSVKATARILNVSPHSVEKVLWALDAMKKGDQPCAAAR